MLNYCRKCGSYRADKIISTNGKTMTCPKCGFKQEIKRLPLFIITGASGVGKSTIALELYKNEKDYIVLESDILWNNAYNTPEDDYLAYRELQLRLSKNISQVGKPVVLCGSAIPKQYENCVESRYFSSINFIAMVCDEKTLEKRLRVGRNVNDDNWINSSIEFNKWLIENKNQNIKLIDTSKSDIKLYAKQINDWIISILNNN